MTKHTSIEIERKFLVQGDDWMTLAPGVHYCQGYLSTHPERVVRVRIEGDRARLTIKGKPRDAARPEYEYEIPLRDAEALLGQLCEKPLIEKVRYTIPFAGHHWEVDRFEGENEGLVVAEIELAFRTESFERPPWVGAEVTDDPRYLNSSLVRHPYRNWAASDQAP